MERIIPVVVIREFDKTDRILRALRRSGIHCAEITFRTAYAEAAIGYGVANFPDMTIGAGTVLDAAQCERALRAGAKFIVSPGLDEETARMCAEAGVPYYPGCVTPTEIMRAMKLGITTVKFFPAHLYGGLNAIKALAAPFPRIKFIPTGGVTRENLDEYLACESVAAVGGSFFVEEALRCEL